MDALMLKRIDVYEADGSRYCYYTDGYQHLDELLMDVEKHHFFDRGEFRKIFPLTNPYATSVLIDAQVLRETFKKAKEPVTPKKEEPEVRIKRDPKPRPVIVHFINADGDDVYVTTHGLEAATILRDELWKLKIPTEVYSTVEEWNSDNMR